VKYADIPKLTAHPAYLPLRIPERADLYAAVKGRLDLVDDKNVDQP
jgi:hypothetical protein